MSKITRKFLLIILVVFVMILSLNSLYSTKKRYNRILDNLRDKASILSKQMDAAWYFVEVNQDLINTTEKGDYEFKGLHCAIVGKSIGAIFSKKNDLVQTHYTNLKTRNAVDAPDEFEREALRAFERDPSLEEYYMVAETEGHPVFRYLSRMTVKESCLECHGSPAGQLDKTGYPKEGWEVGDMGGAVSMTLNMGPDLEVYRAEVKSDLLFAILFTSLVCAIVFLAVQRYVIRPLEKLEAGVSQVTAGKLTVQVDEATLQDEFLDMGRKFNEMSRELQSLYGSLEEQVVERTEELKRANDELAEERLLLQQANEVLQKDNNMKTDFLSIMSHELRTPLTAILTFTTLLKKAVEGEEDKKRLDEIEMNGMRLLDMINNTLELARVEAGHSPLNAELIDIFDVVSHMEASILPLAEKKGIEFSVEIGRDVPLFYGDWEKLCRIMENLCSNAVKFTDPGGRVLLSVHADAPGKTLQIRVKDNGIGIEAEKLPVIFERFVQSDSSASRRYSGSGLGLSLVKQLVEMHGGQIVVTSEPGKGSEFVVTLPIRTEEEGGAR